LQLESQTNVDDLKQEITSSDFSKLNANIAFGVNSLYYIFLKANGNPIENHKVNDEINRVKSYMKKN